MVFIRNTTEENKKRKEDLSKAESLVRKIFGGGLFRGIKRIRKSPYCVYADTRERSVFIVQPGSDSAAVYDEEYFSRAQKFAEEYENVMGRHLWELEKDYS